MTGGAIERVKGTLDLLPREHAAVEAILDALQERFARFGYRGIETPVLEHAELHLRKSGRHIISRLYSFADFAGRRLCLRPEMTASVMRAYLAGMLAEPLPVRLSYAGPMFRYERPQRGRYRQFLNAGVELIGAAGPMADAEVIRLACEGMEALGLSGYRVRVGHLGILSRYLDSLGLDARVRSFLLSSMEDVGKEGRGVEFIAGRLEELGMAGDGADADVPEPFAELLEQAPGPDAAPALVALLRRMYGTFEGERTPEEIAGRLLEKGSRARAQESVARALQFLGEACAVCGPTPGVFSELRALLDRHGLDAGPCEELEELFRLLAAYGPLSGEMVVDLGFGRGLEYYTGMIFEIQLPGAACGRSAGKYGPEGEVCGGGRYDDLAVVLGGEERVPACGFAFGVDRLKLALEARGRLPGVVAPPRVLVLPMEAGSREMAIRIAGLLRAQGVCVELEVRERSLKKALQHADRIGAAYALLVGADEREGGYATVRDMAERTESRWPLERLAGEGAAFLAGGAA